MAEAHRSGKKGRKIGRQENKPCHKRYNTEQRWDTNKLRRAKKTARKFNHPVKIKYAGKMMEVTA